MKPLPFEFVLHRFVKRLGQFGFWIVIRAAFGVDTGDFLIKPPLAGPDFADALQQFVKVIFAETFALLQAFIIEYKTFDNKLFERLGSPYRNWVARWLFTR